MLSKKYRDLLFFVALIFPLVFTCCLYLGAMGTDVSIGDNPLVVMQSYWGSYIHSNFSTAFSSARIYNWLNDIWRTAFGDGHIPYLPGYYCSYLIFCTLIRAVVETLIFLPSLLFGAFDRVRKIGGRSDA